ncbi:MAG: hypothetical protein PHW76_03970 [Alphaproteobacteria bacterium]|nr:hypothetical protein [Alphaproteobacteria bacterium]
MNTVVENLIPSEQNEPLGILVVDTNTLFGLSALYPDACPENPPRPLFEVLSFLGKNGFKVVVPEMVAFEAGRLLRDGSSIDMYFDSPLKNRPFAKPVASFLQEAVIDGSVIIAPLPNADASAPARFLKSMFEVHSSENISSSEKRDKLIQIMADFKARDNFGEIAAHRYITAIENSSAPVFYLSEDSWAVKIVQNAPTDRPVYALPMQRFLGKICKNKIFWPLSFEPKNANEVLTVIQDYYKAHGVRFVAKNSPTYLGSESRHVFSTQLKRMRARSGDWATARLPSSSALGDYAQPYRPLDSKLSNFTSKKAGLP